MVKCLILKLAGSMEKCAKNKKVISAYDDYRMRLEEEKEKDRLTTRAVIYRLRIQ